MGKKAIRLVPFLVCASWYVQWRAMARYIYGYFYHSHRTSMIIHMNHLWCLHSLAGQRKKKEFLAINSLFSQQMPPQCSLHLFSVKLISASCLGGSGLLYFGSNCTMPCEGFKSIKIWKPTTVLSYITCTASNVTSMHIKEKIVGIRNWHIHNCEYEQWKQWVKVVTYSFQYNEQAVCRIAFYLRIQSSKFSLVGKPQTMDQDNAANIKSVL